jgi:LysM repeat protein
MRRNKSHIIICIVLSIFITTLLSVSAIQECVRKTIYIQPEYKVHIVKPGETLWSIAKEFNTDKDIREVIYDIKQLNNVGSVIYANQELLIPDYK